MLYSTTIVRKISDLRDSAVSVAAAADFAAGVAADSARSTTVTAAVGRTAAGTETKTTAMDGGEGEEDSRGEEVDSGEDSGREVRDAGYSIT